MLEGEAVLLVGGNDQYFKPQTSVSSSGCHRQPGILCSEMGVWVLRGILTGLASDVL